MRMATLGVRGVMILMVVLLAPPASLAAAQDKPALSGEIAKVLAASGPDGAQARFDEIYPAHKADWTLDMTGFGNLMTGLMAKGNTKAGTVVMGMMQVIGQDPDTFVGMAPGSVESSLGGPPAAPSPPPEPKEDPLGPARSDLDRFTGLYGDPDESDPNRKLWVSVSCDGHLVAGAMFGDASNWWLRSTGDTSFEAQVFGGEILTFSFEMGGSQATAMIHQVDYMPSPLQRTEPLPDEWAECVQLERG